MNTRSLLPTCLVILTFLGTGCTSLQPSSLKLSSLAWWDREPDKPEPQIPDRLVTTWVDTVKHTPGQKSERGFGGRILFFSKESSEAVAVEGQLVVYAYDESEGDPSRVEPTRRFIFPAEQFEKHQSESRLGPSYSVWLPWDKVGGPMKNVSLITRFEPKGAPLIVGEPTSHLLPGEQLVEKPDERKPTLPTIQLTQHAEDIRSLPLGGNQPQADKSIKKELTSTRIPTPQRWNENQSRRR